jgi:hypothetical protein
MSSSIRSLKVGKISDIRQDSGLGSMIDILEEELMEMLLKDQECLGSINSA